MISNIDKATGALTPFMDISGLTFDDANEKVCMCLCDWNFYCLSLLPLRHA